MRVGPTLRATIFVATAGATFACHSDDLVLPSAGILKISTVTTGSDPDTDGYTIQLDSEQPHAIATTEVLQFDRLDPGDHRVRLDDLAPNCRVAGENPRTISLTAGQDGATVLSVTCTATPRIVFWSYRGGRYGVYTMRLDGTRQTNLTPGLLVDYRAAPMWAPDGSRIAFLTATGASWDPHDLYLMNPDGTGQTRLSGGTGNVCCFAWAPDGSQLAYSEGRIGGSVILFVGRDGTGLRTLTTGVAPEWSPDGKRIAFRTDESIEVINVDGSNQRELTQAAPGQADLGPRWSPDGSSIAFARNFSYPGDDTWGDLWMVDADGTNPRALTSFLSGTVGDVSWSHDGKKLAFSRAGDIYLIEPSGAALTNLTNTPLVSESALDWSRDDSQILFAGWTGPDGETEIFVMKADGTQRVNLTNALGQDFAARWQP